MSRENKNINPLVFLPGLLCDQYLWQHQAQALSDVIDTFIADLTHDDTIADMARRVLKIIPHHFSIAAFSMGGYVAFEILRQAPERVTKLALFSTSAAPDSEERALQRRSTITSLELGKFKGITYRFLPKLIHISCVTNSLGEELQAMSIRVGSSAFLRQQKAILNRPDFRPILRNITIPTLVASGYEDTVIPVSEALNIHHNIPGSKFYLFTQCGHIPPLEKPQETNEVLRQWFYPVSQT
ncbi:Beta-ketoadipate enol-lactone hydrolase [Liberibacter crescens BT-1]|uniref:Beta-ketoadipate enol-lactone hydrolase n=1 Tax=Liberibacter crescens (strain BT-1) TaxID=1215343 RepID=L0ESU1_LIBCB|nr:alpha/beta hydrolase [Liberibacter crescens]AGA64584.1 Beta-ketoadipate enol-lactone hydrolase [Liberibacter crescens BT-1]AMC12717.1 alpha/beta hydrolase [Liberibacter crescens]